MTEDSFILRGTWIDTPSRNEMRVRSGYGVCREGIFQGIFDQIPPEYAGYPVRDAKDQLIIPGLCDLHLHAPQYAYTGTAMDLELLEWLEKYTFPEESRYADPAYAAAGYQMFVRDLAQSATTRACVFATIHTDATLTLMHLMAGVGIRGFVGKLNMDRNCPDYYRETDMSKALDETRRWIKASAELADKGVYPILTPRFTPSVSDAYMCELGKLAGEYRLPVQSHLSENPDEIIWVSKLAPDTHFYAETYDRYGMFGSQGPALMAHCIYSNDDELALIRQRNVMIAHCPTSNTNVIAGMCPVGKYLRDDLRIGLGSDVAGGHTLDMFTVMQYAVQVSKLRWRMADQSIAPLTMTEALYMATAGGGSFFGKVGLFEKGYEMDALILDEEKCQSVMRFSPQERLERYVYAGKAKLSGKYVRGYEIPLA